MNVIFGSGLIGMIAKECLAGHWEIVPFSRSLFYSSNPPLADNAIIRDAEIDEIVGDLGGHISSNFYRFAYSINGEIVNQYNQEYTMAWLSKMFIGQVPSTAIAYWTKRLSFPIYDLRAKILHDRLQKKLMPQLVTEAKKGVVTEIGDHYFIRNGQRVDFDNAISTIPLPVLYKLAGMDDTKLKTADEHYYLVKSDALNFEGHNQLLVIEDGIQFYRCANIAPGRYMFYSVTEIPRPGVYLLQIIGPAEVMDGTMMSGAVPLGEVPDLAHIEKLGVYCIGSRAQHDWCMDVGSCIKRLVRYSKRGYTPSKPQTLPPPS